MPIEPRSYTTAEAAALSGVDFRVVANAIGKRLIEAGRSHSAAGARRMVTEEGVLRLKIWHETGLAPRQLRALFDVMRTHPRLNEVRIGDLITVDVGQARKQLALRIHELELAEAMVVEDTAVHKGEPVFEGTHHPVRNVARKLAEGLSPDEVLDAHPGLAACHLDAARLWVSAHPHKGRPKVSKT